MNFLRQGKRILVTGAARGLGLAVAEAVVATGGKIANPCRAADGGLNVIY